ncbi:zinc finger protein ZAT9-like [Salvia hispanica]|uniref:zinc finger protein ZAT9-like n=1 Tax=Salvia hispanica TaxID=49212 RepID=UPI0020097A99|nr:zinc finger protein ZAT9-like [Salvia hispanica]
MGQIEEEQRYVCRICSKSCVSGKSLGGHMRVHLSQIAASKKAAAQEKLVGNKMECDDEDDDDHHQLNQSISEEVEELGDGGDQSNASYELRENPKKSWRISDPKHAKSLNSCRECGKEFASLRALSGHMRCHSIKNKKEVHSCKECGRGFDSMRAMFGHMKSHSTKRVMMKMPKPSVVKSGDFCPIRRKRSRIRYKGTVNPLSCSGVDVSHCGVSDLEEAEEAARCLVMLSRGVGSFFKFDSNAEDSDDDSAYFGGVVASYVEKNVSEFEDEEMLRVEKGMKVDLVCDDEFLEHGIGSSNGSDDDDESCFENENLELIEVFEEKKHSDSRLLLCADSKHDRCGGEMESSKGKERECPICFKVFASGQALGGHKRAHYNGVVESKNREMLDLNFPVPADSGSLSSWFAERSRGHEAMLITT